MSNSAKPDKFCGQCGQKNFRPNRSLKELFTEFVEDWLGYDSKIYKTAAKLIKPAALSLDYFANSHHKNHYITPIRLYLLLSVIYFVLTQFGGFNLEDTKLNLGNTNKQQIQTSGKASNPPENQQTQTTQPSTNQSQFKKSNCPAKMDISFGVDWMDKKLKNQIESVCEKYGYFDYLPADQKAKAQSQFVISAVQQFIDILPQLFFFCLPIMALILGVFYLFSKKIYVQHLVLLMHSHSFIFAAILLFLGWLQIAQLWQPLESIPVGALLAPAIIVYLFLSQKWFYQKGWWATLWRFLIFGFLYIILIFFFLLIAAVIGVLSI